jgi:hypothetical protein
VVARLRRTAGALVASVALLTVGACTDDPPTSSPPPTVQPSPPETSLERQQREDFAAAEKSYRAFLAEFNRIVTSGGALQPTPVMRQTTAGKYLTFYTVLMRRQKKAGQTYTAGTKIGYVKHVSYSSGQLMLEVCEDGSANKVLDTNGKQVGQGQILVRTLYMRPIEGTWKVWNGDELGERKSCAQAG